MIFWINSEISRNVKLENQATVAKKSTSKNRKKCHVGQLIGFFPQDKLFWTHFYPMISMICVIISINLFECKTMQSIVVHTTFEYVWISHARPMSIPRFHGRGSKPIFSVDFGLRWFVSTCRPCGFTKRFETAHRPWGIIWWSLFFEWVFEYISSQPNMVNLFINALSQVSCGSANLYMDWFCWNFHGIWAGACWNLDFLTIQFFREKCNLCFHYTSYPHSNTFPISNDQLGPCQHAIHVGLVP